jgi:hypothetical protein
MTENLIVPDDLVGSFKRLLSRVPADQRDDETLQQTLLMYLKLGGEKLARQRLEIFKKVFPEQMILIKRQLREGVDDEEMDGEGSDDDDRDDDLSSNYKDAASDEPDFA